MAKLIDKDALVAEIERRMQCYSEDGCEPNSGKWVELISIKHFINTLEVKEVDLKDCDAMNGKIDDSDISCNSTFCSVHTTCKYFNPEKESNVKHCFGGVPMQLKYRKEQSMASKEVDLEKEMDTYFETMEVLEHENIFEDTFQRIAKHFFELGLKANNPITSADRGTAEEIIINLKKIESDYNVCLTKEIEWVRKQVGQPELKAK